MDLIRAIQVACTALAMQHELTYCEHSGLYVCHSTSDRARLGRDAYNRLKEAEAELRTAELALDIRGEV